MQPDAIIIVEPRSTESKVSRRLSWYERSDLMVRLGTAVASMENSKWLTRKLSNVKAIGEDLFFFKKSR